MNFCTYCGAELEEGLSFCTGCGSALEEQLFEAKGCIALCTTCGEALEEGRAFCTSCGAAATAEPVLESHPSPSESKLETEKSQVNKPKKKRGRIIGVTIAVAVVLAIAGVLLARVLGGSSDSELSIEILNIDSLEWPSATKAYVLVEDSDESAVEGLRRNDFVISEKEASGGTFDTDITSVSALSREQLSLLDDSLPRDASVYCITYSAGYDDPGKRRTVYVSMADESGYTGSAKMIYSPSTEMWADTEQESGEAAAIPSSAEGAWQVGNSIEVVCMTNDATGNQLLQGYVLRYGIDSSGASCVLPESDVIAYTEADLAGLSPSELCIARNEVYARHGYAFKNNGLSSYFTQFFAGYMPMTSNQSSITLSSVERSNVELIQRIEGDSPWSQLQTEY